MPFFRSRSRTASVTAEPGRNDPCPCGSGRKYKHCCADKRANAAPDAGPAPSQLDEIRNLRDRGRFVEATRLAETYARQNPTDAAAHAALGMVHIYAGRFTEAAQRLSQAVRLAPNVAQHHHDLGWALDALGRDAEAASAFQRAVALDPHHSHALERLGVLMLNHGKREEALDCFRRVARIEPDTILGRISGAKVLLEEGKRDEALELLQANLRQFPDSSETKRFLAAVLREEGRFEEAIPFLEAATEGTPLEAATAYFDLAMSKRITKDDEPALEQMNALLDFRPLPDVGRQRVHFALGKANDDLGDYAAAMRHFDAGNRLAGRGGRFDRAHFGASVHRMITSTTPEFFRKHPDFGSRSDRVKPPGGRSRR